MKVIKRFLGIVFAVCLLIPCFSATSHAADGVLSFSDPTTAVGETFEVRVRIQTNGQPIGDGFATISYDPAFARFISGNDATGADGTVELQGTGNGTQTELLYTMQFMALQEGSTTMQVTNYTSYLYSNETLNLSLGSSTITIGPGTLPPEESNTETSAETEPAQTTGNGNIEVNGVNYSISDDFSDALIPIGYERAEMQLDGANHKVVKKELGETVLVYLNNGTDGDFFYYNSDDGSYSGIEQVEIARDNYILLLQSKSGVSLPEEYQETTFELNGKQFPAWQDPSQVGFCVVNAIDSHGQQGTYQVDSQDKTYQRFVAPVSNTQELDKLGGNLEKIFNWLHDNIEKALIGFWIFIVIVILTIIILASKLHNRNRELDDLYEEYEKKAAVKSKKQPEVSKKAKPKKDMEILDLNDEDDFKTDHYDDEFNDDDIEDDDFEDDFDDLDAEDDLNDYDSYEDYDNDYEVNLDSDDSADEKEQDFDLDFIDLD
ncbi:MAG TPA: hypothetical protein DCZ20_01585 [Lachnospiraceae bacterium]|nr:hypothetical protein [Lachnospiraceae bacterium]